MLFTSSYLLVATLVSLLASTTLPIQRRCIPATPQQALHPPARPDGGTPARARRMRWCQRLRRMWHLLRRQCPCAPAVWPRRMTPSPLLHLMHIPLRQCAHCSTSRSEHRAPSASQIGWRVSWAWTACERWRCAAPQAAYEACVSPVYRRSQRKVSSPCRQRSTRSVTRAARAASACDLRDRGVARRISSWRFVESLDEPRVVMPTGVQRPSSTPTRPPDD